MTYENWYNTNLHQQEQTIDGQEQQIYDACKCKLALD